jgi:hypothetical protein
VAVILPKRKRARLVLVLQDGGDIMSSEKVKDGFERGFASLHDEKPAASLSRRGFLLRAGASGLAAAAAPLAGVHNASAAAPDGTPEQIHLTWGEDPSSEVVVS